MKGSNKAITIVRGDDTNFNGVDFLTIKFTSDVLDLSTFKAKFTLGNIIKTFDDLSSGEIVINFSASETSSLPSELNGTLSLIDSSNRIATLESLIPFKVISIVDGNAIATKPYTLNMSVEQGGINILNFDVAVYGNTSNTYTHNQAVVSNTWIIEHNLNKHPSVTVIDSAETVIVPNQITYIDKNTITVSFLSAFSGKAYLN